MEIFLCLITNAYKICLWGVKSKKETMSNESETWMQIMCKAACPHHQELQPNWLFDQNRVRNRYSSILQLHNQQWLRRYDCKNIFMCKNSISIRKTNNSIIYVQHLLRWPEGVHQKNSIEAARQQSEVISKHICQGENVSMKYCIV